MKNKPENKNKETKIEKPSFQTSYTYYIFLLCNFVVMLGLAICLIFTKNQNANFDFKLPVIICNIFELAIFSAFLYLELFFLIVFILTINGMVDLSLAQ